MKLFFLMMSTLLISCSSQQEKIYETAKLEIEKGHFRTASTYLEQTIKRDPTSQLSVEAAKDGAKIALYEIKDYQKAIYFLKMIVQNSKLFDDVKQAEINITQINFDNLQNYNEAIKGFNKILEANKSDSNLYKLRLNLARAYYYKNDFLQSEKELQYLLSLKIDDELTFQAMSLLANIYLAQKYFPRASEKLEEIIKKFPEQALKENTYLNLSVCFEEIYDYKRAIATLEKIKDIYQPKEYITLRIKRLLERQKNAPGARGLGKK